MVSLVSFSGDCFLAVAVCWSAVSACRVLVGVCLSSGGCAVPSPPSGCSSLVVVGASSGVCRLVSVCRVGWSASAGDFALVVGSALLVGRCCSGVGVGGRLPLCRPRVPGASCPPSPAPVVLRVVFFLCDGR